MEPSVEEIEAVGNALININHFAYTTRQLDVLNDFLKNYANHYNKEALSEAFEEDQEIFDALHTLHQFVLKFESNQALMEELKVEMDEIMFNLNHGSDSISI